MRQSIDQRIGAFILRAPCSEDREHYRRIYDDCNEWQFAKAEKRLRWMERDLMERAAMAAECRAAVLELAGERNEQNKRTNQTEKEK